MQENLATRKESKNRVLAFLYFLLEMIFGQKTDRLNAWLREIFHDELFMKFWLSLLKAEMNFYQILKSAENTGAMTATIKKQGKPGAQEIVLQFLIMEKASKRA